MIEETNAKRERERGIAGGKMRKNWVVNKLLTDADHTSGTVSSPTDTDLSGKYIMHNFEDSDGAIKPYKGKVIAQVPGFLEWYNVV